MSEPRPNCQYTAACNAANCDGCPNDPIITVTAEDVINAQAVEIDRLIKRIKALEAELVELREDLE